LTATGGTRQTFWAPEAMPSMQQALPVSITSYYHQI